MLQSHEFKAWAWSKEGTLLSVGEHEFLGLGAAERL